MALKRIQKELDDFNKNPPMNITVGVLDENNLFICHAAIIGPNNSPYVFIICVYFPYTYPFDPPSCICITKIYHPNINSNGSISIDILTNDKWNPKLNITKILVEIYSILKEPDPEHPYVFV